MGAKLETREQALLIVIDDLDRLGNIEDILEVLKIIYPLLIIDHIKKYYIDGEQNILNEDSNIFRPIRRIYSHIIDNKKNLIYISSCFKNIDEKYFSDVVIFWRETVKKIDKENDSFYKEKLFKPEMIPCLEYLRDTRADSPEDKKVFQDAIDMIQKHLDDQALEDSDEENS